MKKKRTDLEILYLNIWDIEDIARDVAANGSYCFTQDPQEVIDALLDIQHLANVCLRDARAIKRKREV